MGNKTGSSGVPVARGSRPARQAGVGGVGGKQVWARQMAIVFSKHASQTERLCYLLAALYPSVENGCNEEYNETVANGSA